MVLDHAHFAVSKLAPEATGWTGPSLGSSSGTTPVAVFIVLSGFSLAAGNPMRGGYWAYVRRRARRILPPYYAALGAVAPTDLARPSAKQHG